MSDDEDPFDALDGPADGTDEAETDPFEQLGEHDRESEQPDDPGGSTPGRMPDDPFERRGERSIDDRRSESEPGSSGGASRTGAPGGDSGVDGGNRGDAPGDAGDDPFASFSDVQSDDDPFEAFESAGVGSVDHDAVWAELSAAGEGRDAAGGKEFAEVSKHRFCERCEHFSGPPEVTCTYEGAAIVEFLDMETVRLVNCPIVAERRDLGGDVGPE